MPFGVGQVFQVFEAASISECIQGDHPYLRFRLQDKTDEIRTNKSGPTSYKDIFHDASFIRLGYAQVEGIHLLHAETYPGHLWQTGREIAPQSTAIRSPGSDHPSGWYAPTQERKVRGFIQHFGPFTGYIETMSKSRWNPQLQFIVRRKDRTHPTAKSGRRNGEYQRQHRTPHQ